MSRFVSRLKQVSQGIAQPMGFKAASTGQSQMKMLLVAGLAKAGSDKLPDCVAGADAGLIIAADAVSGTRAIKEASEAVSAIPWGGRLESIGADEMKQIAGAGGDFLVLPAASGVLSELEDSQMGTVLEIEMSLDEGLLSTVNRLPVDAALITAQPSEGPFLTWHRLMYLQRCADLLTKPLVVSIPLNLTAAELKVLWDTGVDGVIVEMGVRQPAGGLSELRRAIDGLPPATKRSRGKRAALLPYTTPGVDRGTEEPDED
jgi:hypothetical protein